MQRAAESIKSGFVDWAPVVDKNFLHDTPQVLRKKGEFKQVPLIITFTSNEGATFLGDIVNNSYGLMESVDESVRPCSNHFLLSSHKFKTVGKISEN